MKKLCVILLFLIICPEIYPQRNLDSLYGIWLNHKKSDSIRVEAYDEYLYSKYIDSDVDSLSQEAEKLIKYGKEKNYPLAVSYGYNLIAESYYQKGLLAESLDNFKKSYDIIKDLGFEKQHVTLINTLGALSTDIGKNTKGLEYFERALNLSKEIGDKETMEMCVSNIGGIYYSLGNYDKALDYYNRGKELESEMGDQSGYASSLNLIGSVLIDKGKLEEALYNINEAIKIFNPTWL